MPHHGRVTSSSPDFQAKLARYAELLVKVGVNLPAGGKLLVNAPLDAAPLVRQVVRAAYQAGALDVDRQPLTAGLLHG